MFATRRLARAAFARLAFILLVSGVFATAGHAEAASPFAWLFGPTPVTAELPGIVKPLRRATRERGQGTMVASFYGAGERLAKHTASGEVFRPGGLTAAHRSYPFGTRLQVCHAGCVVVRVNDRGPFVRGRSLDLSAGAARAIGLRSTGVVRVARL